MLLSRLFGVRVRYLKSINMIRKRIGCLSLHTSSRAYHHKAQDEEYWYSNYARPDDSDDAQHYDNYCNRMLVDGSKNVWYE